MPVIKSNMILESGIYFLPNLVVKKMGKGALNLYFLLFKRFKQNNLIK